jgi:hypothetical protein
LEKSSSAKKKEKKKYHTPLLSPKRGRGVPTQNKETKMAPVAEGF